MELFLVLFDPEIAHTFEDRMDSPLITETLPVSSNALLLAAKVDDAAAIRTLLGFGEGAVGLVFKLNGSYSGYYYSNVVDFLQKVKERSFEPA